MKPHLWFVRAVSHLVPRRWRSEWKQEWDAELQHGDMQGRAGLLRRSLGAFWDALAMQPRRLEEEVFQDLRFGMRMFAKDKALTVTAILSLALGIGVNSGLFSMVDAVLLKKLPVKNPDELVLFQWTGTGRGVINGRTSDGNVGQGSSGGDTFSYRAYQEFRLHNKILAGVFAFAKPYNINLAVDDIAEVGNGEWVSGSFFSGLGVDMALGRPITEDDDKASSTPAAVISYPYWQRRFGLSSHVLGKTIKVNNAAFTIVGVCEPKFAGTLQVDEVPDVFVPLAFEPAIVGEGIGLGTRLANPNNWWVYIAGRMKPGTSIEQVRAGLQGVFDQTNSEAAASYKGRRPQNPRIAPDPLRLEFVSGSRGLNDQRERFREPLLIIMVLVGLVLVIACANVANLLLARAATREREISVRLALGARRFRLIRQVLTESLLLAVCGGICGVVLAYFVKDLLLRWGPWNNPASTISLKLDWRVLAFTAGVSALTGIVFGLAPAFAATRRDLDAAMKEASRTVTRERSYLGKGLIVLQVALSIVLLIGAGLFIRTMHNFRNVVAGYDPDHLLQFDINPALARYDRARVVPVLEEMIERIRAVPGVRSASFSCCGNNFGSFTDKSSGKVVSGQYLYVRENFFDTVGVPMLMGRPLTAADTEGSRPVLVVNEAFVHANFPDTSPLGKTANGEIVGVVRDAPLGSLRQQPAPAMYWAFRQGGGYGRVTFRVRTNVDAMSIYPSIRDSLRQVESRLPVFNVRTFAMQVEQGLAQENMFAGLSTLFGILAVVLTCVGFYGIMAYSVARRTSEIGVRLALGAKPLDVLRLIMSEGLFLVIAGSGVGIAGALASTQYIESILFGLPADDGITITAAVFLMIAVAAAAAFFPARKAARLDPVIALRYE